MAFTPTTWIDGTTAITATELNRIETGIDDAHTALAKVYVGRVASDGTAVSLPTGFSSSRSSAGAYIVSWTPAFADASYTALVNVTFEGFAFVNLHLADSFYVAVKDSAGVATDAAFRFLLVRE